MSDPRRVASARNPTSNSSRRWSEARDGWDAALGLRRVQRRRARPGGQEVEGLDQGPDVGPFAAPEVKGGRFGVRNPSLDGCQVTLKRRVAQIAQVVE